MDGTWYQCRIMNEPALAPQRVTEIAAAFAAALDRDDFAAAGRLLADRCVYDTGQAVLDGRAAVLRAYAEASAWVRSKLDEVRYESEVERVEGMMATVRFTDYLIRAGGRFHRHRCSQELTLARDGTIVRIVHREIRGEREALEAFFGECGITPSRRPP